MNDSNITRNPKTPNRTKRTPIQIPFHRVYGSVREVVICLEDYSLIETRIHRSRGLNHEAASQVREVVNSRETAFASIWNPHRKTAVKSPRGSQPIDSWPTTAVGHVSYQRFIPMVVGRGFFRCLQGTCYAIESSDGKTERGTSA